MIDDNGGLPMVDENPYKLRGMIPIDSNMFFGREREMRRIADMLSGEAPQCVSIIGERRIGKSSLANRVFHGLRTMDDTAGTRAVYLDCDLLPDDCLSKDQFFQFLNQKFLEAAVEALAPLTGSRAPVDKDQKNLFVDYPSFKAFIGDTGRKDIKTVIFLDEFEHLPCEEKKNKHPFADDTFFSNLRAMANDPANRLAFVTLSKTNLKELTHRSIQSSGFWNIFQEKALGLLDPGSISALRRAGFDKAGISLTPGELEKIHYYAGDFPFFNQVVCSFLWEAKINGDEPGWDDVEVELLPFYEKLWEDRTREEQKLLKHLKDKEDMTLKVMKSRGIIIKEGDRCQAFSGYFSSLIEKEFEMRKEKLAEKESIQNLKEGLDILKKGKDIVMGD
jgi:hypothetical protein